MTANSLEKIADEPEGNRGHLSSLVRCQCGGYPCKLQPARAGET